MAIELDNVKNGDRIPPNEEAKRHYETCQYLSSFVTGDSGAPLKKEIPHDSPLTLASHSPHPQGIPPLPQERREKSRSRDRRDKEKAWVSCGLC